MDELTYDYYANTNRLKHVGDDAGFTGNYTEDIDDQANADNYTYDAIGNLKTDASENITAIDWTVYGKIATITKNGNTIAYSYDAAGNRITKTASGKTTVYARDATGNVMSVYEKEAGNALKQSEVHLYGSSRLGLLTEKTGVAQLVTLSGSYGTAIVDVFTRNEKVFELSNHLGNVLTTVADAKIAVASVSNSSLIDHYTGTILSAQDYYSLGMQMPGRKYSSGSYRYGFNGKENDNEVKGEGNGYDYGARIYDPRIGRWLSTDPIQKSYPHLSPYNSFENNPIYFNDPDGKDAGVTIKGNTITISTKVYIYGSAATSANALIMQQDIMSSWSTDQNGNNWSYRDQATGTIYNVKFDVQVELYDKTNPSKEPGFFSGRNNPFNTDNYIEVGNNSNTSFVKGGDEGEWRGQGRGGKTLVQDNPAAHEFGHLIGLDDRYSSSGPLPTWNGNVMAEPAGLGVVEQKNIDAILKPQVDRFNKSATKLLNDKLKTNLEYKTKIDESNPSWERDKEKKQKSN